MRTVDVGSVASAAAVTPSDSAYIATTKGIYVGGAGNLAVEFANGTTATFTAISIGIIHPISVRKVLATGTTATTILALY